MDKICLDFGLSYSQKSHHLHIIIGIPTHQLSPMPSSPMAIGLSLDSHRSYTQMAIRLRSDSHSSRVRWPSEGVNTPHSFSLFRKTLIFGTLSVRRISVFLEPSFVVLLVPQWFTSFKRIKNRVFPSRISLTQEYAILACGIYSLTKCQQSNKKQEILILKS